jgi:hypothetical protein
VDIPWVEVAFVDSSNARVVGAPWWSANNGRESDALYWGCLQARSNAVNLRDDDDDTPPGISPQ